MTIQIQLPFNPQILISILIPKYMVMGSSQLWNQQVSKHLHVNTAIIQSVASDPHAWCSKMQPWFTWFIYKIERPFTA